MASIKSFWGTMRRRITGLLNWLDVRSSLILALAGIIALFIYDDQRRTMRDTLEVLRRQQRTTDSTLEMMRKQTKVLTVESIRRFRPFPIISMTNTGRALFKYGLLRSDNRLEMKDVGTVAHGSPDWDDRIAVAVAVENISFQIGNSGNSPLYIVGRDIGGLTCSEWLDDYSKSDIAVCRMALEKESFWRPEIDLVIMPSDSAAILSSAARAVRTMGIAEFDAHLDPDSSGLPFYVYLYLQYEDLYGNTYDALWMTTYVFDFRRDRNSDGEYVDSVVLRSPFREKMRWDVLCANGAAATTQ